MAHSYLPIRISLRNFDIYYFKFMIIDGPRREAGYLSKEVGQRMGKGGV